MSNKIYYTVFVLLIILIGCEYSFKSKGGDDKLKVEVQRYDRLESRYLTTGDHSALQQMNTTYPMETRMLIENVLKLGEVNEPEINSKFLNFYQDTVLQNIIVDVESEYADMDDINEQLTESFERLQRSIPDLKIPSVYAQIGALDQSIIIGNSTIGISLDKYLGADYPIYRKYYPESQRATMERSHIVPDCFVFYLLSLYPLQNSDNREQIDMDLHMAKIMWVVNKILDKNFFKSDFVNVVDRYMHKHKDIRIATLLKSTDYSIFK